MDKFVESIEYFCDSILNVLDKACGSLFGSFLEDDE